MSSNDDDLKYQAIRTIISKAQSRAIERYSARDGLLKRLMEHYTLILVATYVRQYPPQAIIDAATRDEDEIINDYNFRLWVGQQQPVQRILPHSIDIQRIDIDYMNSRFGLTAADFPLELRNSWETATVPGVMNQAAASAVSAPSGPSASATHVDNRSTPVPQRSQGPPPQQTTATPSAPNRGQATTKRVPKTMRKGQKLDDQRGKLEDSPNRNLPFPRGASVNMTAVEILAYFPQSISSLDIVDRFMSNGAIAAVITDMVNTLREQSRGKFYANAAYRLMEISARAYAERYPESESRWKNWTQKRHIKPDGWDSTSVSVSGFRILSVTNPGRRKPKQQPSIQFRDLAQGVKELPKDDDALDLTRMIDFVLQHPGYDYFYPDDWDRLLYLVNGPIEVRPGHHDAAVFDRYASGKAKAKILTVQASQQNAKQKFITEGGVVPTIPATADAEETESDDYDFETDGLSGSSNIGYMDDEMDIDEDNVDGDTDESMDDEPAPKRQRNVGITLGGFSTSSGTLSQGSAESQITTQASSPNSMYVPATIPPASPAGQSEDIVEVQDHHGYRTYVDRRSRNENFFNEAGDRLMSVVPRPASNDVRDFAENWRWVAAPGNTVAFWTDNPVHMRQIDAIRENDGWVSDEKQAVIGKGKGKW